MTSRPALALLVVSLALAGWLRWTEPQHAADLKPRPDALEYEEGARALARGDGYSLVIDGERYPPRYPPGLSLLIRAAFPITGSEPGVGVRVVFASSLVGILATWLLGATAGGLASGSVAALLIAISPLDAQWSQRVMSDVPSSALCAVVGAWSLVALARGSGAVQHLAIGILAGLSVALRPSNVAIALPVLAVPWIGRVSREWGESARRAAFAAAGLVIGLVPLAAYQLSTFGSPWRSGHGVWRGVGFALRFAFNPTLGAADSGNLAYYAQLLVGRGSMYSWPVAGLIALGAISAWRRSSSGRRLVAFSGLFVVALLAIYVPFFWQWDRFLLPALPFVAATAAQAFAPESSRGVRAASMLLLVGTIGMAAWPSQPWRLPEDTRLEASILREIDATIEADAVLIMRTDPFSFRALLRHDLPGQSAIVDRQWVPVGASEHSGRIVDFGIAPLASGPAAGWILDVLPAPFDPIEARKRIDLLLDGARPVYFATSTRDHQVSVPRAVKMLIQTRFETDAVRSSDEYTLYRVTPMAR